MNQTTNQSCLPDLPANLSTTRFSLRPVTANDATFFWRHFSDPTIMAYIREPASDKQAFQAIFLDDLAAGEKYRHYRMIIDPPTNDTIGIILIRPFSESPVPLAAPIMEMGYMVTQKWWGKGVACEVAHFYHQTAINHWGLDQMLAVVQPENRASVRVLEKCGFKATNKTSADGKAVVYQWRA